MQASAQAAPAKRPPRPGPGTLCHSSLLAARRPRGLSSKETKEAKPRPKEDLKTTRELQDKPPPR